MAMQAAGKLFTFRNITEPNALTQGFNANIMKCHV